MRVVVLLLLVVPLAGCFGGQDEGPSQTPPATVPPSERPPAQGIDWSLLSKDEHAVLPPLIAYVPSFDGVRLHVRAHLPDGSGPWPTILQNSPYYTHPDPLTGGNPAASGLINTYVPKGYAVVTADVRGTGNSEGCMDMMGLDEQRDTYELVEWIAAQPWSDGHVGMQGVSYVGTTPHEALIMAPPHLDTVVTVAGVTNQWRNVYQNGVPYANRFYPITYEATEGAPPPNDFDRGQAWAANAAAGACGQEEALAAMAPGTYEKGVYSGYWHERNFTRFAGGAKASLLYSQGFVDRAVNPMEAVYWFNELPVVKKGFFHQAGHQYPPRADYDETELAWFDYWLKGIENGILTTPIVEVQMNGGRIRIDDEWPSTRTTPAVYHLAPGALQAATPSPGRGTYLADAPNSVGAPVGTVLPTELVFATPPLAEPLLMAGSAVLHLRAGIEGPATADNTYWLFDLYDEAPGGGSTWIAEGWFNGHLKAGFDRISPMGAGIEYEYRIRFEPRDYLFQEGHRVRLVALGHDTGVRPFDEVATQNFIVYGPDASRLELPTLPDAVLHDAPPEVTDGPAGNARTMAKR